MSGDMEMFLAPRPVWTITVPCMCPLYPRSVHFKLNTSSPITRKANISTKRSAAQKMITQLGDPDSDDLHLNTLDSCLWTKHPAAAHTLLPVHTLKDEGGRKRMRPHSDSKINTAQWSNPGPWVTTSLLWCDLWPLPLTPSKPLTLS